MKFSPLSRLESDLISITVNILIASDKFKGSLTARQVNEAIREGLLSIDPTLNIVSIPLADGGEGTCDLLTEFRGGSKVNLKVLDPLFRGIESGYGIASDGKIAFIEMAKASGLQLLKPEERNALNTSTFGTGQLIADALNRGVNKIILAIGGSATNDGGIGMAEALGFVFLSEGQKRLKPVGQNLIHIHSVREDQRNPHIDHVEFIVIYDVKNPLFGEQGAAYVFAPQKGATPQQVRQLDQGLEHFAKVIQQQYKIDINFPGAGAAGGLGGGAKLFLNARFSPGIDFILQFTSLEKQVKEADLVITGEGKIDEQTFSGKVVQGVAQLAAKHQKKCIAFTGKLDLPPDRIMDLGVQKVIALAGANTSDKEAMRNAFQLLKQKAGEHLTPWIHPLQT